MYTKKMNIKKSLSMIGYAGWCGLGFMRGIQSYKYNIRKYKKEDELCLYTDSIFKGVFGMFVYGNPIFFPLTLYKEIYRLEINTRNLETEKSSSFYNDLL